MITQKKSGGNVPSGTENRPASHRLFIAIDLPDEQRDVLTALHDPDLPARWTRPEQLHLTLRFVGDVSSAVMEHLDAALARLDAPSFELALHGLGVFPSMRRPRVLFAGLAHQPALLDLQQRIEDEVRAAGIEPDTRPFHPHVTLARLRRASPRTVRAYLRRHQPLETEPFPATQLILYESFLHSDGAIHRPQGTYALKPV